MSSSRKFRLWSRILLAGALLLAVAPRGVAGGGASEYSIEAAYLFNFAQFVQWPAGTFTSKNDPIVLGVFSDGELPADLQAINGRAVPGEGQNRIIQLKHMTSAQDIDHCQMLFIMRSGQSQLPEIIHEIDSRSILTVLEDADDLVHSGAVFNLFKTPEKRIRFEINVDAAKRAGLKIDSPLLNLAIMAREH